MTTQARVAAVTGASGYLGSRICAALESRGWQVVELVRSPGRSRRAARAFDLATPISLEVRDLLTSADVLVHAAYDLSLTKPADIWRVNVDGTRRLLGLAADMRMRRILVLSSMSAFPGTTQLYGRAKLEIEALTVASGGCAVRPGLVYGDQPGGMTEALRRLTRLPIVPVIAGAGRLYTVREDDLMNALAALSATESLPAGTISIAHPRPVALSELMTAFAAQEGRSCHTFPVPWQLVYFSLRTAEVLRLRVPFRADSLLGLVHPAREVSNGEPLTGLGITLHAFVTSPAHGS